MSIAESQLLYREKLEDFPSMPFDISEERPFRPAKREEDIGAAIPRLIPSYWPLHGT